MKICPACHFSNSEDHPTCIWCNEPIFSVKATPAQDPAHPEHAVKARRDLRERIHRQQALGACVCYALAVPLSALCIQAIPTWWVFLLYAASSGAIAAWLTRKPGALVWPALAQSAASVAIVFYFGPLQPFVFFMLGLHSSLPILLSYWLEMIEDVNR